jgi:hypothetical protein
MLLSIPNSTFVFKAEERGGGEKGPQNGKLTAFD